ncbi:transcription termination factor 3, mitochondrial-like [Montipora capricornis]|uniref:transcription termination factor 3, mitochondrial-like n=1 Tax=Montipora capricornis TaxID=246305 RepID=UPI0035F18EE2
MAASVGKRAFHLLDFMSPRLWVLTTQNCFVRVHIGTESAPKLRHFSKRVGTFKKTKTVSLANPREVMKESVHEHQLRDLLRNLGVKIKKLKDRMDVEKLSLVKIKSILNFLEEIGIEEEYHGKIIARRPAILTAKEYLLKTRVQAMGSAGINPDSVAYVVKESPGVLTGRTEESLPEKLKFFENLAVKPKFTKDEILHVLTKCPHLIATYTVKSLEDKVQFLSKELKFNKHHLKNIILKQPSVLTFRKEAILEKYKYCYEKLNISPSGIARCPRVFQCSVKRIQERHKYLRHLGRITDETTMDDYGLGLIVTTSDKQFVEKVAKTTMVEFDQFKEDMDSFDDSIKVDELSQKQQEEEDIHSKNSVED